SQRERSQLTAIPKTDHIFTISKKHKSILEMMEIKKPIHVFENVTDFYNIPDETIAKAYGEGKKFKESLGIQNLILYCGRLYPKKGSLGLFDSFKKIRKEYPSTQMVLLGANEEMAKEMISYGLDEESLKHTSFVPWIVRSNEDESKFLNYFLASDVLIQPMITPELYSRAVIDAMALGIPAISCESPYTIGSSQNSQAIFESFIKIKENQKEVEKIVQKAKEKIKRENTWDSYISRLEKIISV
ncbi:MAG: glycosyltransferase family 4 protein, partial [Nanoarchaeota archaeon]|nr:glycosyltransferase family 4 protein [Nanoarchaeota archaeon]